MNEMYNDITTLLATLHGIIYDIPDTSPYQLLHLDEVYGALRQAQIQLRYAELAGKDGR